MWQASHLVTSPAYLMSLNQQKRTATSYKADHRMDILLVHIPLKVSSSNTTTESVRWVWPGKRAKSGDALWENGTVSFLFRDLAFTAGGAVSNPLWTQLQSLESHGVAPAKCKLSPSGGEAKQLQNRWLLGQERGAPSQASSSTSWPLTSQSPHPCSVTRECHRWHTQLSCVAAELYHADSMSPPG